MKVVLTGGSGFVGGELKRYLKDNGHQVRLFIRSGREKDLTRGDSYEIVTGDVLDTNACRRAVDGCDAVIHLVGIIREYLPLGITFRELHTHATANIVDAAKREDVKRLIHMSALGTGPNARSNYHHTKFKAEEIVRHSGLSWTIFRPSLIFGEHSEFIPMLVEMVSRKFVPLIDGGASRMQPIMVDDVCRCFSNALIMPETYGQTIELGGPDRVTFKEMIEAVAAHLERRIKTVSVPSGFMKPLVKRLERFPSFPLTHDQLLMLKENNVCDTEPMETIFHLTPMPAVSALPRLIDTHKMKGASRRLV